MDARLDRRDIERDTAAKARPARQTALRRDLLAWARTYRCVPARGRLAEGRPLAERLRSAYRRGTLGLDILGLLYGLDADERWLSPRRAAWAKGLASAAAFRALHGRPPREREGHGGHRAGAWLSRQRGAERRGRLAGWQMDALVRAGLVADSASTLG